MSHPNSKFAFQSIDTSNQEAKVLQALQSGPMTRRQISEMAGLETSAVAGRVNTLMKNGMVVEVDNTVCERTGKTVAVLALKTQKVHP